MRILQGIGGALMVPVGRLAVLRTTPKHLLIKAIATLTACAGGPIIGPPLGGFITRYASWHWIFFINVPLGVAAIILSLRIIPDIRETERRAFDMTGFITTAVTMVSPSPRWNGSALASRRSGPRWPSRRWASAVCYIPFVISAGRRRLWFVSTPCRCRRSG